MKAAVRSKGGKGSPSAPSAERAPSTASAASPKSSEFLVILTPEEHQEYLRRRKGAISAPKETDLRDDGAEADVRSQASARPASMAGLLQQMGKKGGSGSLKQQAKATAATSPTSSTPTGPPGFLSFVMVLTPEEHKEYLRRRRQFRGRPQEEQLVCEIASLSRRIDHLYAASLAPSSGSEEQLVHEIAKLSRRIGDQQQLMTQSRSV
ncbi:Uncharacterized protein SCF082_LOCUS29659 [Durusdinium trenchii]|uniref:Uncharacterized protein n=1 Tax=Durusdinium trenchii TaxID=1381693 RepID=A0ABP0MV10_9DINO